MKKYNPQINHTSPSLRKHHDFNKLWFGETVSLFGAKISELAFPLLAISVLEANPFQVGLLGTLRFLPFLLVTLLFGAYLDRRARRPVMIFSNLARGAILLLIPLLYIMGELRIEYLYVSVFLIGLLDVSFDLAYFAYLPSLIKRDQLNEGNSKLQATASIANVGGGGIAGIIIQTFTAPIAIFIDAMSYLVSAISILIIKKKEEPPLIEKSQQSIWKEIREGLSLVFSNPYISKMAGEAGTYNLLSNIISTVFIIYAVEEIKLQPGILGIILASGGAGAFVGSFFAVRITEKLEIGPAIIWGTVVACFAPMILLMVHEASLFGSILLILSYILSGFGVAICNVNIITIRQSVTPDNMLSKVNASYRLIGYGGIPIGSFLGGYFGEVLGLYPALMIGVFGMPLCILWLWFSPMKTLKRDLPATGTSVS
jgi:MFS family permease